MKASKISKVAGLSFLGFCVAAATADKVNLNPLASQVAGFVGAFVGSLVATGRRSKTSQPEEKPMSD
jgi:hypothetical protein